MGAFSTVALNRGDRCGVVAPLKRCGAASLSWDNASFGGWNMGVVCG